MARPSGDAARVVVTEYDLPITQRENELPWYNGADWMDGPSTGMHGIVGTHDVVVDAAGYRVDIAFRGSQHLRVDRAMLKLDPKTGDMTAVKLMDWQRQAAAGRADQQHRVEWGSADTQMSTSASDARRRERVGGRERLAQTAAVRDQRNVGTRPPDGGMTDVDGPGVGGQLTFHRVQRTVLEEQHRIGILDRGPQHVAHRRWSPG